MRRGTWVLMSILVAVGGAAEAAVFERFLSPENPADRAIARYVELERSGKASSNDLAELGVLLMDKGFPKDAERYLKKALRADRTNYEAAYRLGLVYQRVGREWSAMRAYRRVLSRRPGHTYARFMLALAQERAGRRDMAIRNYVHAYRHLPQLADPSFNPLVLTSRLQTEAALLHYRRTERETTFKVEPIDPEAVRIMMRAQPPAVDQARGPVQPAVPPPTAATSQDPTPTPERIHLLPRTGEPPPESRPGPGLAGQGSEQPEVTPAPPPAPGVEPTAAEPRPGPGLAGPPPGQPDVTPTPRPRRTTPPQPVT